MFSHPALKLSVWFFVCMVSLAFVGYAYSQSAQSGTIKWNPGHYVRADEQGWINKQDERFRTYDTIRNVPTVLGAAFVVNWGMIENQRGVYDWSYVDAEINYLAAMGKRSIITPAHIVYGWSVPSTPQGADNRAVGDYLIDMGCVGNMPYGGHAARLDIQACMDRYIAFIQALATRYDSNPNVEMVTVGETSVYVNGQDNAALAAQWNRLPAILASMFRETPVVIQNNFLVDVQPTKDLIALQLQYGIGQGGPDLLPGFSMPPNPNEDSYGELEIRGAGVVPGVGTFGTIDNRARVPQQWEAQVVRSEYTTAAILNDYANNNLLSNHTIWTAYNGYAPNQYGGDTPIPAMRWDGPGGVLEYLSNPANRVTHTACPTAYGGRCSSGGVPSPTPTPTPTPPPPPASSARFRIGETVVTTTQVNVRSTPSTSGTLLSTLAIREIGTVIGGPSVASGYTWWQVRFDNGTTGWAVENYLQGITIAPPPGGSVTGANWCSLSGMASTSPGGMCQYLRNESLRFGISRSPGDTSAVVATAANSGTDILGYCGNADTFGSGRVEVILKTSGTAGPGECVIRPNTDYFVNVTSNISFLPLRPQQTQEDYAILFTRLPGQTAGTPPPTPVYTRPVITPNPTPSPSPTPTPAPSPASAPSTGGMTLTVGPSGLSPTPPYSVSTLQNNSYFVSAQGNDANDGRSPATAWRTLTRVGQSQLQSGSNVFFRAGDQWTTGRINVSWGGTVTDPAVIGSYFIDASGQAMVGVGNNPRPMFDNQYDSRGLYGNIVTISSDNVTIQDIDMRNAGDIGIRADNRTNIYVKNVKVDGSYHCGMYFNRNTNVMVEFSEVYHHNTGFGVFQTESNWCSGISQESQNVTLRNNIVADGYGEGISAMRGVSGFLYENNILRNNRAVGIYVDSAHDGVIRNNMIFMTGGSEFHGREFGIGMSNEAYQYQANGGNVPSTEYVRNMQIYNNIVAGLSSGAAVGMYDEMGFPYENIQVVNNTFIDNQSGIDRAGVAGTTWPSSFVFANNIVVSQSAFARDVGTPLPTTATVLNNYWSQGNPGGGMDSSGDVYTGLQLTKNSGWASLGQTGFTWQDARPTGNPPTRGAGASSVFRPTTDIAGNAFGSPIDMGAVSNSTSVVTPTPSPSPTGSSIKWNPGHYVMSVSRSAYNEADVRDIANIPGVRGWHQYLHWSTIETSRGVYDWTFLDGLLSILSEYDLKLIINLKPRTFGGSGTSHLPSYLATEPGGGGGWYQHPGSEGVSPKIWLPAINDRYIALVRAIGERYNNHPNVEAFEASETSFSNIDGASDWDYDQYLNEQRRFNVAAKAAFPNTLVFALANYSDSQAQLADYIEDSIDAGLGIGMPDTYPQVNGIGGAPPQNLQWGERIVMGQRFVGGTWVSGQGTDQRGRIPLHAHVADPELGGKEGSWTPQQFYEHAVNSFGATHMSWSRKNYTIGQEPNPAYEDVYWNTGNQPRIRDWLMNNAAARTTRTTCPTGLAGACSTPQTASATPVPAGALPVIPGGVGYGITTPAGSGRNLSTPNTTVYRVTTLNDSGVGSLRTCVEASGPRTCIFETSGSIALASDLEIRNPYITIAGQTAPSPGIMLRGWPLVIMADDVLVQHLRIRIGDAPSGPPYDNRDAIQIGDFRGGVAENIVLDHISVSWAVDENVQIFDNWDNVTLSNSVIANPLNDSFHPAQGGGVEPHGYGLIASGQSNAGKISLIGNLFANSVDRSPLADSAEVVVANNVIYNAEGIGTHIGNYGLTPTRATIVGNVHVDGATAGTPIRLTTLPQGSRVYMADIIAPGYGADPWSSVVLAGGVQRSAVQASTPPTSLAGFTPRPAAQTLSSVLTTAGARPQDRDSVDAGIITGVSNRTGRVINCVTADGTSRCSRNAGGWPTYQQNTRALTLPANPNSDSDGDGYTNLEEWLHGYSTQS